MKTSGSMWIVPGKSMWCWFSEHGIGGRTRMLPAARRPASRQTDSQGRRSTSIGKMPAMLLGGGGRQDHDRLPGDGVVHLGPGQPVVPVFDGRAHNWNLLFVQYRA